MRKILLGGIAIVAIAVATALSVNVKSNEYGLSELGLKNVKALADKPVPCYLPKDLGTCWIWPPTTYCYCGM